ncbi:fMet-Leu-Phe receptor-like [Alosa sapidissima]|uniref:fMet-Leu-Phe receptor-like n=1 Tax=Alosa sapidissima TaxID=34773 RepID=UPI001C093344|nr:fMet-Leu-Phe receptor-like [Alosa sapidissima]XP_041947630.1 fMet-Leu-Phe receptor-like [Alosa sapidissima]XP_041947631.1 fMet-Leu-Phe receptor-like [Alosa sapidissima]XP_041947632.1 fMet-Leu-Phe receptor-like [Alosa sapidissima]
MAPNISLLQPQINSSFENDQTTVDIYDFIVNIEILFCFITVILGTVGNALVIWVAGISLRAKVTYVWLVNLATADFIFCLTRAFSLAQKYQGKWSFGVFLCKFNGFFKYTNMFCSVFLLAVISLDRALCVLQPVFIKQHRTVCAARLVSVVVWVVASVMSAPYFIHWHVYPDKKNHRCGLKGDDGNAAKMALIVIRLLCGFFLPFVVILLCSVLAGVGIRRTQLRGKSRPLRMLVTLVAAFFLCWAPYHCFRLAKVIDSKNRPIKVGLALTKSLAYFNSCVNPVLYFCMGIKQGWLRRIRNAAYHPAVCGSTTKNSTCL